MSIISLYYQCHCLLTVSNILIAHLFAKMSCGCTPSLLSMKLKK